MPDSLPEDPDEIYGKPRTLEEAIQLSEQLKNKYPDLLEKYKMLMEKKQVPL
jgi:hypothetical protein